MRLHQQAVPGATEVTVIKRHSQNHPGAPESPARSSTNLGSFLVLWTDLIAVARLTLTRADPEWIGETHSRQSNLGGFLEEVD